jgi:hypothetical protein
VKVLRDGQPVTVTTLKKVSIQFTAVDPIAKPKDSPQIRFEIE